MPAKCQLKRKLNQHSSKIRILKDCQNNYQFRSMTLTQCNYLFVSSLDCLLSKITPHRIDGLMCGFVASHTCNIADRNKHKSEINYLAKNKFCFMSETFHQSRVEYHCLYLMNIGQSKLDRADCLTTTVFL